MFAPDLEDTRLWRLEERNKELVARLARAEQALEQAVEVIKRWHGPQLWDLYWRRAPKMQAIRDYYATKGGG